MFWLEFCTHLSEYNLTDTKLVQQTSKYCFLYFNCVFYFLCGYIVFEWKKVNVYWAKSGEEIFFFMKKKIDKWQEPYFSIRIQIQGKCIRILFFFFFLCLMHDFHDVYVLFYFCNHFINSSLLFVCVCCSSSVSVWIQFMIDNVTSSYHMNIQAHSFAHSVILELTFP